MDVARQRFYSMKGEAIMENDQNHYTIADIEQMPADKRAELIDGKLFMMASPGKTHQEILSFIFTELYGFVKREKGKCKVYPAPFAVYLDESNTYVEPDIMIICDDDKLDEKGCHGAPELVIEVVSQSSVNMDYVLKLFKYRLSGVREYWIVDPNKKRVLKYEFMTDNMTEYTFIDKVPVSIYGGKLEIDFAEYQS